MKKKVSYIELLEWFSVCVARGDDRCHGCMYEETCEKYKQALSNLPKDKFEELIKDIYCE